MSIARHFAPAAVVGGTAVLLIASPVAAHAELTGAIPADGSVLPAAPTEIILSFSAELDPDGSRFVVTDASGATVGTGEVDLSVADRNVLRGAFDAPSEGAFAVAWTATAIDGHVETGMTRFSVGARSPDTALAPPSALAPVGIGMVVGALVVALHRRRGVVLVALALVLAACVTENRPESCADPGVTIDLTLTATSLDPENPSVCRDQDVTLVVTSEADGVLHVHGYDEDVPATTVSAGQQVTLEFQATRSGQFPIEIHTDAHPEGAGVGIFTVYEP